MLRNEFFSFSEALSLVGLHHHKLIVRLFLAQELLSAVKLAIMLREIENFFLAVKIHLLRIIQFYLLESEDIIFPADTIHIASFQLD
jgi:hypothetical protein